MSNADISLCPKRKLYVYIIGLSEKGRAQKSSFFSAALCIPHPTGYKSSRALPKTFIFKRLKGPQSPETKRKSKESGFRKTPSGQQRAPALSPKPILAPFWNNGPKAGPGKGTSGPQGVNKG